jgi:hypothetical protein
MPGFADCNIAAGAESKKTVIARRPKADEAIQGGAHSPWIASLRSQ